MTTWSANQDLTVSAVELAYYERRARNVDYVVTACAFTLRRQQCFINQFFAGSDDYLDSLAGLAQAIHRGGAQAILQIHSPGYMVFPDLQDRSDIDVVSASAIAPKSDRYRTPRALTIDEIGEIVGSYYDATWRAIKVGYEGVEILGGNTFLPQQFLSPRTNRRDDIYGRDRLRFARELVDAVLQARVDANRPDFLVGYRFSAEEKEENGLKLADTFGLLDMLCATPVDYLHLSVDRFDRTSLFEDTLLATALLGHLRQRKPLVGVGRIMTSADVARAFALGYDHVALGTTLLLNPDWKMGKQEHLQISDESIPEDIPLPMRGMLLRFFA